MNNTIKGKITIPTIKGTIPGTSYTQSSSDYEVLTNKPQINGVELLGNKTTSDLGIESFSGDYNDLTNKPSIPSKTSELTNDSNYQNATQVQTAINNAIGTALGGSY